MILKELRLQQFRSYKEKKFQLSPQTSLVVGPNASGKTNLLEAVSLLGTGKSVRGSATEELVYYGQELARVTAKTANGEDDQALEIVLTTGQVQGEKTPRRRYLVNGVAKRRADFAAFLPSVYFGPQDLELIIGGPSIRRSWLDAVLETADWEYRRSNLSYQKGLRQRNRLLEKLREGRQLRQALFFWDKLLIENGQQIATKRQAFIDFINEQPDLFWRPKAKEGGEGVHSGNLVVKYQPSVISPERLAEYADQEVGAGMTLIGPHRDDFQVNVREPDNGGERERNLHVFGSRGEQRTAVFCLKLAELEFVSERLGKRPILLLDDVFSELDQGHRYRLLVVVPKQQTIITTTDLGLVDRAFLEKLLLIELE